MCNIRKIKDLDIRILGYKACLCVCCCGTEFTCITKNFEKGKIRRCSKNCKKHPYYKPKLNNKYGKLLVIEEYFDKNLCKCLCDCGNYVEIKRESLVPGKGGGPKSCGCLWSERYGIESIKEKSKFGNRIYSKEIKSHKLYNVWTDMRRSKGKNPGTVDEWKDYKIFYDWAIDKWQEGLRCYSKDFNEPHGPNNTIFVHPSIISKESQNRPEVKEKIKKIKIEKYGYYVYTQDPNKKHLINPKRTSKQEKDLRDFIEKLGIETKKNRKILNGREIDIYIENLNLGIEYCGIYWHCEINIDKKRHIHKYKEAKEKGITLITIFSDEWTTRRMQVENLLKSKLNKNKKVHARKCVFKKITLKEGKDFVNQYHIQELKRGSKYNFGLFYNNELVSVMLFDKHPRDNSKLSLNRYCSKFSITVVGGANKLFKNALKLLPKSDIYTWSDNRLSNGELYNILGFSLIRELPEDYSYIKISNPRERIPKQKMKKSNINCPKDITEKDFLRNLGYARIWDCGKKTWLYKR